MGRRLPQGKRSVKAKCPSCGGTRALRYNFDAAGDCIALRCRGCGHVFPAGLTRAEIMRPFPPGTRRNGR